jgi:hypothetical protein
MSMLGTAERNLSPDELTRRMVERRAVEAVIWGMPAVNFELMYQAMFQTKGAYNQIVYWSRLPDWKNQTLTPNPDVICLMPFINTKDVGPVVIEIPPADEGSFAGAIMDAWQVPLEDVGPAGLDNAEGGAYLILPPGYMEKVPDGYITLQSDTYAGYAVLYSNLNSGSEADIAKAVTYGKQVQVYPLAQAANPPTTTYVDAVDVVYDTTIPYDQRFFQSLNRFVQTEPWLHRDKAMLDKLKSIGIEQGKPFAPDAATQEILERAVSEAHAWLDMQYESLVSAPYVDGSRWSLPIPRDVIEGQKTLFASPDNYPIDGRSITYSFAFSSSKRLGAGQFYLMAIKDQEGRPLHGDNAYRLNVPVNVAAKLYWSATVYDRATHAHIRSLPWSSRSSLTSGLQKNADGSVDIYFGVNAPAGKESNWIPTSANGEFEVAFRFYSSEQPQFDETWTLPNIEEFS